jgi:predicted AlkP superfamily phosphohydrolase/phosphomutase
LTTGSQKEKIFVIGLDGATIDLIKPWVDEGFLPNLGQFMKDGVHGDLASTIHPLTAPAWTSFMTGKNPGKHGVFDFIMRKDNAYEMKLVDSTIRDQNTLWKILSEENLRVGVMNIPLNYPPQEVNGWLISWMDAPGVDGTFTYPESLAGEIRDNVGEYIMTVSFHVSLEEYIGQINRMIENRSEVTRYLMDAHPWDFMITLFSATDYVQHAFWKFMDKTHPGYTEEGASKFGDVICDVYRKIDSELGLILDKLDDSTKVFIMSDHGAGPLRKVVNLNKWLEINGYLTFKGGEKGGGGIQERFRKGLLNLFTTFKRRLPASIKASLKRNLPDVRDKLESYLFASSIDWRRTRAFSLGAYGNISLNVRGREPDGIVEEGSERETLLSEISEKLLELKNPDSGEPVVEKVHRREELYSGRFTARAPDLIVQWTDYAYHSRQRFGETESTLFLDAQAMPLSQLEMNGFHRLNGVFMARGQGIRKDVEIKGASIVDLAPTILYILGLPIPDKMDGKVLTDIFTEDYQGTKTLRFTEQETVEDDAGGEHLYSDDEEDTVKERLRGLGYID